MSESAKALRQALLQSTPFVEEKVTVTVPDGKGGVSEQVILVRQPTVGGRDRIVAEMQDGGDKRVNGAGLARAQALSVVLCCLDPQTRAPIFTEADVETLIESPAGSFVDVLANTAMSLMGAAQTNASKSPAG